MPAGEHRVDGACGRVEPLLELARRHEPRPAARAHPFEVALLHPPPLRLELANPVVAPGDVEVADDEQVVRPGDEVIEADRGRAEVDLVEEGGRERVRVGEQDTACERREEVLVPAMDPRDVGELPAGPVRSGGPSELRVRPAVLGVPERRIPARECLGERRLTGRLRPEQAHPLDLLHGARAYAITAGG